MFDATSAIDHLWVRFRKPIDSERAAVIIDDIKEMKDVQVVICPDNYYNYYFNDHDGKRFAKSSKTGSGEPFGGYLDEIGNICNTSKDGISQSQIAEPDGTIDTEDLKEDLKPKSDDKVVEADTLDPKDLRQYVFKNEENALNIKEDIMVEYKDYKRRTESADGRFGESDSRVTGEPITDTEEFKRELKTIWEGGKYQESCPVVKIDNEVFTDLRLKFIDHCQRFFDKAMEDTKVEAERNQALEKDFKDKCNNFLKAWLVDNNLITKEPLPEEAEEAEEA